MNKKNKFSIFIASTYVFLIMALMLSALKFKGTVANQKLSVIKISDFVASIDGSVRELSLPESLEALSPRTPVTLASEFTAKDGDCLYIKSVYSPIKIYINEDLVYKYGQEGTYPKFMQDPATVVKILQLPNTSEPIKLKMEYLSPISRDVLTIHPLLLGSEASLINSLFQTMGFSFVFSIIQIIIGLILIVISVFVISFERKGIAFFWLGLFSLAAGGWTFGESNLTAIFFNNYTLLYLMAFLGLFSFPIPLIYFGLSVVDFHNKKPLKILALFLICSCSLAMFLQLLAIVSLSKSMYLFHFLIPLSLVFLTGYILYESIKYKNKNAIRIFFPVVTIPLFAILEVINYQFRFTNVLSFFFQIGIIIFIFMTSMIGGIFIRDSLVLKGEKQELEYKVKLMKYQIQSRKKHDKLLLENAEKIKMQRHDLRHQLTVIRNLSESNNSSKLTSYIKSMIDEIPSDNSSIYCENIAVNAIISHYVTLAKEDCIDLKIKLVVPESMDQISDNNLCIIFGNLFENAIEACNFVLEEDRFIRLNSRLKHNTLTITMDNSFDGKVIKRKDKFLSRKRDGIGIGLSSIAAVAEKHCGNASFESDELVFLSSVYVGEGCR